MNWLTLALEAKGCPRCLVGVAGLRADPMFICEICSGTGIPYFSALSATEELLTALKAMVASYDGLRDVITSEVVLAKLKAADAAIAKAEGR